MEPNRNEWVIHVWGKKRDVLELTNVEKFHIDMLRMLQDRQKKFDRMLVNIALDDVNDKRLFNFLKKEIKNVLVNGNVEFKFCQNDPRLCEYVTFRPYVFDRIGEDVNIFYTHFKGYNSFVNILRESYPVRVTNICEMFWSYVMYMYSLNFNEMWEKVNDKCTCSWFVWKREKIYEDYYYNYQKCLRDGGIDLKKYVEDNYCKHSPGSFGWYNMRRIGDALKDKPEVRNITTEDLIRCSVGKSCLCTHFCELYLMQFLKDEDCYSLKDYNTEWVKFKDSAYSTIYTSKLIGLDFLDDFNEYLIEKKLL